MENYTIPTQEGSVEVTGYLRDITNILEPKRTTSHIFLGIPISETEERWFLVYIENLIGTMELYYNMRIRVKGEYKQKPFTAKDGSTKIGHKIYADSVTPIND